MIAIVGEAWGKEEEREGKPFQGPSGKLLDYMLKSAGIAREDCLVTNIVNKRPKDNKFYNFTQEEIQEGLEALRKELAEFRPNVVVALGAIPLKYLCGEDGITKYRGSVLPCTLVPGLKVLATFHPAWLLRGQDQMVPVVIADLAKAKRESTFPELRYPQRNIQIIDSESKALSLLRNLSDSAVDIETTRIREHGQTAILRCIGFAPSPSEAYVLSRPLTRIPSVLRAIAHYLKNPHTKIFHNATFDCLFLAYFYRILTPPSVVHDTMLLHHACYPNLPKSLAFCASLYTNEPYWKDDKDSPDGEALYIYNGKDCCLTIEIFDVLKREAQELKVWDVYEFDRRMLAPAWFGSMRGMRVDMEKRAELIETQRRREQNLRRIIEGIFPGVNPNSSRQVGEILYDRLRFPEQKKRSTGRRTVEARALRRLASMPLKYRAIADLFRIYSEVAQQRQFVEVPLEPDGRVRYYLHVGGTLSGRLSSSKFITLSGFNFQNQPKSVRSMYIPDEGYIFIQFDLSQAEARLTAAHCGDRHWLETFDTEDVHTLVASELFGIPKEKVDRKTHRQVAKRVSHGANYMMGSRTLADILLCGLTEAKRHLDAYYSFRPSLKKWQYETKRELIRNGELRTVFGRRLPALYNPLRGPTDEIWRQAVSFRPQSECPDYINRGVLWIYENLDYAEFLLQVHDSCLFQVPMDKSLVHETILRVKAAVEQPITINGLTFTIPADFEIGMSWGEMYEVTDENHQFSEELFEEAWERCMSSLSKA